MDKLIFLRKKKGRLIFTTDVVNTLLMYRQVDLTQSEAGGLLVGRHLLNGDDLAVDIVTKPTSGDLRSLYGFYRSEMHQSLLERAWAASDNTATYLGNWHTHPEPVPTPSSVDYQDWNRALSHDTYEGNNLFFVIVGQKKIRCWEGHRQFFRKFYEMPLYLDSK